MSLNFRKTVQIAILGSLSLLLVNCSENSSDSGLYGSGCTATGTCSTELSSEGSQYFVTPRAEAPVMECTHDHIQVGGACETNGAIDSYIEYQLQVPGTNGAQIYPWAGSTSLLREARCENGRYYMIIPRPLAGVHSGAASTCATSQCMLEAHLSARMFVMKKGGTQFELAASAPLLPISIQQLVNGGAACP